MNTTEKQYFVSDLHLLARRSSAMLYMPEIVDAVRQANAFVLGGDIFDFKWSSLESFDASLDAAQEWLRDLMRHNADCQFHFILGNHDAHPRFTECLEELSRQVDQFTWHRYYVRLNRCLYLHGDIADDQPDHDRLDSARMKFDDVQHGRAMHALYELAVTTHMHRLVGALAARDRRVLQRLLSYAEAIGHGPNNGVSDVYFGHTHRNLDAVLYEGLRFHNGGAAIRGLKFRVIESGGDGI